MTETPSKSAPFAVLMGAIAPILPLYAISLAPPPSPLVLSQNPLSAPAYNNSYSFITEK